LLARVLLLRRVYRTPAKVDVFVARAFQKQFLLFLHWFFQRLVQHWPDYSGSLHYCTQHCHSSRDGLLGWQKYVFVLEEVIANAWLQSRVSQRQLATTLVWDLIVSCYLRDVGGNARAVGQLHMLEFHWLAHNWRSLAQSTGPLHISSIEAHDTTELTLLPLLSLFQGNGSLPHLLRMVDLLLLCRRLLQTFVNAFDLALHLELIKGRIPVNDFRQWLHEWAHLRQVLFSFCYQLLPGLFTG